MKFAGLLMLTVSFVVTAAPPPSLTPSLSCKSPDPPVSVTENVATSVVSLWRSAPCVIVSFALGVPVRAEPK